MLLILMMETFSAFWKPCCSLTREHQLFGHGLKLYFDWATGSAPTQSGHETLYGG